MIIKSFQCPCESIVLYIDRRSSFFDEKGFNDSKSQAVGTTDYVSGKGNVVGILTSNIFLILSSIIKQMGEAENSVNDAKRIPTR